MKKQRLCVLGLASAILLGLTACGSNTMVPVQQVGMLTGAASASDKYAGMVVSEKTTQVQRDSNKTIKELFVSEGDTVTAGQKLFSYDVEQLQLELERQQLELERLNNDIASCNSRLTSLNDQLKKAKDTTEKTNLNLQISSETANKNEANYNRNVKQKEISQTKSMLSNVTVTSPVDGRIRQINNDAADGTAYITIQDTGSYRIKGTLNELSLAGGIAEGVSVNIISRVDPEMMWRGVVSSIDYEGGSQSDNNNGMMMGGVTSESTGTSTSYPFYVELDSSDGLLLGQHVYIEVAGDGSRSGLWIPDTYLFDFSTSSGSAEGVPDDATSAAIWVANDDNKLEQRTVTLGQYDSMTGTYEILDGLSLVDYVADPASDGCTSGASVSYRNVTDFEKSQQAESVTDDFGENDDSFVDDSFVDDGFGIAEDQPVDTPEVFPAVVEESL